MLLTRNEGHRVMTTPRPGSPQVDAAQSHDALEGANSVRHVRTVYSRR
jgi:hypothetical protein